MAHTWFVLGREPLLSYAEIKAVTGCEGELYTSPLLIVPTITEPQALMKQLGGTIKIAQEIATGLDETSLPKIIIERLQSLSGKIIFGLSWHVEKNHRHSTPREVMDLGKTIKRALQEDERSVRYIPNKEPVLSSVTVEKNGLVRRGKEFLIHEKTDGTFAIAETVAVQPFEAFGNRDFGRPGRDDQSGMLPPKLALIMLNLANASKDRVILDPFCGSGTILTEALLQGYTNLIGSDSSPKAIDDTNRNIAWTRERHPAISTTIKTAVSDATTLPQDIKPGSVDAVVTEPYLGKPLKGRETKQELAAQSEELKILYTRALHTIATLLKPGGRIVMVVPRFRTGNDWIRFDLTSALDTVGLASDPLLPGYPSLLYARATQYVGREIWRFVKK